MIPSAVLSFFGIESAEIAVKPVGSGLIHQTYKLVLPHHSFILQQINQSVFTEPQVLAGNIRIIADHLAGRHPGYRFISPIRSPSGEDIYCGDRGCYRLFPFVEGTHSIDRVENPAQAREAAIQFGRFSRLLSGLDPRLLQPSIPHFHNLSLRYRQFLESIHTGDAARVGAEEDLLRNLQRHEAIVDQYEAITRNPHFHLRIMHHDCKISNILFDDQEKGICVIDLDTVMPGYFFSDLGDMLRTYLCPVTEEEQDMEKIEVREEVYRAVIEGYHSEMKHVLTREEQAAFFYSGKCMIFMQALRFLTDHFLLDRYYGARYEGHNYYRALNQYSLLLRYLEREKEWSGITS